MVHFFACSRVCARVCVCCILVFHKCIVNLLYSMYKFVEIILHEILIFAVIYILIVLSLSLSVALSSLHEAMLNLLY